MTDTNPTPAAPASNEPATAPAAAAPEVTSAPAAAPVESAAPAPLSDTERSFSDFTSLVEAETSSEGSVAPVETPPAASVPAAVAAPVPPIAAAPAPTPQVTQPAPAVAPAPVAPVVPAAVAPTEPVTPSPTVVEAPPPPDFTAMRQQAVAQLTAAYGMTEEDGAALMANPEKVIPGAMAQLHVNVYEQIVNTFLPQLPQIIQKVIEQGNASKKMEEKFFERWPKLKGHDPKIAEMARTFRAMNPRATFETAVEQVGAMLMFQLGIPPDANVPGPTLPVMPVVQPHIPVRPSGATPTPAPAAPGTGNSFADLAEQIRREEM